MKIRVVGDDSRFTLPIPNWLMLNSLSAAMCMPLIKRHVNMNEAADFQLSYFEIRRLFLTLRRCRRYLKGEPLVYVRSSDGSTVEIYF